MLSLRKSEEFEVRVTAAARRCQSQRSFYGGRHASPTSTTTVTKVSQCRVWMAYRRDSLRRKPRSLLGLNSGLIGIPRALYLWLLV